MGIIYPISSEIILQLLVFINNIYVGALSPQFGSNPASPFPGKSPTEVNSLRRENRCRNPKVNFNDLSSPGKQLG